MNGHLWDWLHDHDCIDRVISDDHIAEFDSTARVRKEVLLGICEFNAIESSIAGVVALI